MPPPTDTHTNTHTLSRTRTHTHTHTDTHTHTHTHTHKYTHTHTHTHTSAPTEARIEAGRAGFTLIHINAPIPLDIKTKAIHIRHAPKHFRKQQNTHTHMHARTH